MNQEILAEVRASAPRRWLGIMMLAALGGLVIYVALAAPPALHWQVFLLATGVGALWMSERMRRATAHGLELTPTELRSTEGQRLALVSEVEGLERGFLAFKPSNGFMIRTRTSQPRTWRPGLWWRIGRRIGVGGVTPGGQTKAMAEILAAMMAQRSQSGPRQD